MGFGAWVVVSAWAKGSVTGAPESGAAAGPQAKTSIIKGVSSASNLRAVITSSLMAVLEANPVNLPGAAARADI